MDHSLLACSLISSMACRQKPQLVQPPQLWQEQPQGRPWGLQLWGDAHHGSVDSAGNLAKVPSKGRQPVAVPVAGQPPCGLMWLRTGACHSCWLPSQTTVTLQASTSLLHSLPSWRRQYLPAFVATSAGERAQMLASQLARLGESVVCPNRSMQGMQDTPCKPLSFHLPMSLHKPIPIHLTRCEHCVATPWHAGYA